MPTKIGIDPVTEVELIEEESQMATVRDEESQKDGQMGSGFNSMKQSEQSKSGSDESSEDG